MIGHKEGIENPEWPSIACRNDYRSDGDSGLMVVHSVFEIPSEQVLAV